MTVKKILIILMLLASLILLIFKPADIFIEIQGVVSEFGLFWGHLFAFYLTSSTLLFWIGIPAGWRLAKRNCWGLGGGLICAFIGIYLSLPIAIVQLFLPKD